MTNTVTVRQATAKDVETFDMMSITGVQLGDWMLLDGGKLVGNESNALSRAAAIETLAKRFPNHASTIGAQPAKKASKPVPKPAKAAKPAPKAKKASKPAPKPAKATKPAPKADKTAGTKVKGESRVARMFELVLEGHSNESAVAAIQKEFGKVPTNTSSIGWCRSQLINKTAYGKKNNPKGVKVLTDKEARAKSAKK